MRPSISALLVVLFHLPVFAQSDFSLSKVWFIDANDEVQVQIESPSRRLGILANLDFSEPSVARSSYVVYSLDGNSSGEALVNPFSDEEMKKFILEAVAARGDLKPVIYPRTHRYSNGAQEILIPSIMSPLFPMYLPTENPPNTPQSEAHYYELLEKRLNAMNLTSVSRCLSIFAK